MMSDIYDREDSQHWGSSSPGSSSSHSSSPSNSGTGSGSTIPADIFGNGDSVDSFEIAPNLACWSSKRHLTAGNPSPSQFPTHNLPPWRGKDSKLKTAHAALILCLNIGVDPPDTVKTNPCAVLECWVDPFSLPPSKALDAIGKNLQHQFESLNPRMRYKTYLDPSVEDTRKFCVGLRKTAKDERALFYYNGHGVPRPTPSGEIWVFNKGYTQYIPVSILDLQSWLGSPCIYVWDCSGAGHIIENFNRYAAKRDQEFKSHHPDLQSTSSYVPFMDCIQLAACAADETLPMTPELPADLFTSCLTSPIEIALRYFVLQNRPRISVTIDEVMQIPGDLKDRRTPLGELNWIFTAVTDTIAWTTFPRDIFKRLFRQDWTVAALFRNFLLAERIMRNYHCTPRTHPPLPPTHTHSLWASWDLAVDTCLSQLRDLLDMQKRQHQAEAEGKQPEPPHQYIPSTFFAEHLTAFEVWLSRGGSALTKRGPLAPDPAMLGNEGDLPAEGYLNGDQVESPTAMEGAVARSPSGALVPRRPPDQLPILLQVLLSQAHRLRALILLSSFVDLGPWAVHLALTIGIFPYVQKLLQSPATDLRPVLIFIWARILAFDPSCQVDLLKDNGYLYFTSLLAPGDLSRLNIPNVMEHLAMCAFILSALARDYKAGQVACIQVDMFKSCIFGLESDDFLMRQWSALCIAQLWDAHDEAKRIGIELKIHDKLNSLLLDVSAEVRAAVVYAMGVLLGTSGSADRNQRGGGGMGSLLNKTEWKHMKLELSLGMGIVLAGKEDGSPMVRKEVVIVASALAHEWRGFFVIAAWIYWEQNRKWRAKVASGNASLGIGEMDEEDYLDSGESIAQIVSAWASKAAEGKTDRKKSDYRAVLSSFFTILTALFELTVDPYPEVATHARTVVDYIMACLLEGPFAKLPNSTLHMLPSPIFSNSNQQSAPKHLTHTQTLRNRVASLHNLAPGSLTPVNVPDSPVMKRVPLQRSETMKTSPATALNTTIKRTSSFATSLRNLATGYAFPSSDAGSVTSPSTTSTSTNNPTTPHPPRQDFHPVPPEPRLNYARYDPPYAVGSQEMSASFISTSSGQEHIRSSTGSTTSSTLSSTRPGSPHSTMSGPRSRSGFHLQPHTPPSETSSLATTPLNFNAADVMEALMEEDMERLRIRRRAGQNQLQLAAQQHAVQQQLAIQQQQQLHASTGGGAQIPHLYSGQVMPQTLSNLAQQQGPGSRHAVGATPTALYNRAPSNGMNGHTPPVHPQGVPYVNGPPSSPLSPFNGHGPSGGQPFVYSANMNETFESPGEWRKLIGAGTGSSIRGVLPLKSLYYEWSTEYYSEPQMRQAEADEPGSVAYNKQSWREQRNERLLVDTEKQSHAASFCQWDKSVVTMNTTNPVATLLFHSFETHVVTADLERMISVWDWAKKKRIACFDNGNPNGTCVTSLHFINEDSQAMILAGSAEGMVRIYRNYDPSISSDDHPLEMVSAFRVLSQMVKSKRGSGLVTDWEQPMGYLFAGGDSKIVQVWDAHKETAIGEYAAEGSGCVTSIQSDHESGRRFVAGFGDGTIRVYDRRAQTSSCVVRTYQKHRSWVQSVRWQRGGNGELLSASVDGEVCLWDIRAASGVVMDWRPHSSGLSNMAVHDHASVFATTSAINTTNWRTQTLTVQSLPPTNPAMSTRIQLPTGLHHAPAQRGTTPTSAYFPSLTSLAFHPNEMVVGVGCADGTIKVMGCNLKEREKEGVLAYELPLPPTFGDPLPSVKSAMS